MPLFAAKRLKRREMATEKIFTSSRYLLPRKHCIYAKSTISMLYAVTIEAFHGV